MTRPAVIRHHADLWLEEVFTTHKDVEYMNDAYYFMRGEVEHLNHKKTEKEWRFYIMEIVGDHFFYNKYLKGDFQFYKNLNIISQGLEDDKYINNTPMVIFTEKKTRAINKASEALRAAKYYSTGQIPHFECINIAEYFMNTVGDSDEVYLVGLVDFDPAGDNIFETVSKKVQLILDAHGSGLHLKSIQVQYGTDYHDITSKYKTFTLSTNMKNALCQKWILDGKPLGVEFNNVHDRALHLERTILENVSPFFVKDLSEARVMETLFQDLLESDEEYQDLLGKLKEIERKHRATSEDGEAIFSETWSTPISFGSVKNMTEIV